MIKIVIGIQKHDPREQQSLSYGDSLLPKGETNSPNACSTWQLNTDKLLHGKET